jgi:hypothetical protein
MIRGPLAMLVDGPFDPGDKHRFARVLDLEVVVEE